MPAIITTSKLQLLDQGIIKNIKVFYRMKVVWIQFDNLEKNTLLKIVALDSIWRLTKAWSNNKEDVFANWFLKSGLATSEETDIIMQQLEDVPVVTPT